MSQINLNPEQQKAVDLMVNGFLSNKFPVPDRKGLTLIGEGGTGKTTCIAHAVEEWIKAGLNVLLTAPTNKAVKQLESSIRSHGLTSSRINCTTLHKALGLTLLPSEENKYAARSGAGLLTDYDIVVVDEGSMVSKLAFYEYFLPDVKDNGNLVVIMGDAMQLPPVKETESAALLYYPAVNLTKVERFSAESGIAKVTSALRKSLETGTAYNFNAEVETIKPAHFMQEVLPLFPDPSSCENTRILAWTNRRVDAVNSAIRESLYGKDVDTFMVGERVVTGSPLYEGNEPILSTDEECIVTNIQEGSLMDEDTSNEYKTLLLTLEPMYASVSTVYANVIHPDAVEALEADLDYLKRRAFEGGSNSRYWWHRWHKLKDLFSQVRYCYCITVHRSQGSTFETVIVDAPDILKNGRSKERKQLLYVAMSRASKRLIVSREKFTAP